MKLSRKSDYALRALCMLALRAGPPVSIREMAEQNDVPKRFLEQIMLELKGIGMVKSLAGRDGGFILGRPADQITMGQVVRHFDGLLAPIACVSQNAYEPCSQEFRCHFRRVLLNIRNYTAKVMDETSLAVLIRVPPVSPREIFNEFGDGGGI